MSENKKPTNTQIFLFFIGFVALFTLVFVLGVIVGKGLSNKGVAELDQALDTPLNNAETQVDKNQYEPVEEKNADAAEYNVNAEQENDLPDSDENGEASKVDENLKEDSQNAEVPGSGESAEIEKTKENESNDKKVENELGYVKNTDNAKLPPDTLPPTDPEGRFTVQVGSFKDKAGAEKITNDYKSKGYPAFMKSVEVNANETFYRVRIGTFNSREVAKIYFEVLKKKEKDINGFITTNN